MHHPRAANHISDMCVVAHTQCTFGMIAPEVYRKSDKLSRLVN